MCSDAHEAVRCAWVWSTEGRPGLTFKFMIRWYVAIEAMGTDEVFCKEEGHAEKAL